MPILKCLNCHHEWEGSAKSKCEWCGASCRILRDKSDLEEMFDAIILARTTSPYATVRYVRMFLYGVIFGACVAIGIIGLVSAALAEKGFDPTNPTAQWFASIKIPGTNNSCCGYGDAYEADIYEKHEDGSYTATITDGSEITYPDGSIRGFVKNGTKVEVRKELVNPPKDGNPTGHAVLFLSTYEGAVQNVFCFILPPFGS